MTKNVFQQWLTEVPYKEQVRAKESERAHEEWSIQYRTDPMHALHTTVIPGGKARGYSGSKKPKTSFPEKPCDFCPGRIADETADPKIYHHGLTTIPNLFPVFEPHYVTVFPAHKKNFADLTIDELAGFLLTGRDLAGCIQWRFPAMWDFINWGKDAGASLEHPHAQRGGLPSGVRSLMAKEYGEMRMPLDEYLQGIVDAGLVIHETDHVVACAPFAPRFTDAVDVYMKAPVASYLGLEDGHIAEVAGLIRGIFRGLERRGITDLNVQTHQAPFHAPGEYRMHWHIFPRTDVYGGYQVNDLLVVHAYPEDTAEALRKSF